MPQKKKKTTSTSRREIDQFEMYYSDYAKIPQKKSKKMQPVVKVVFVLAVVLALSLCVLGGMILFEDFSLFPGRHFLAGTTIAGVDVGGLTRDEAVEAVGAAVGTSYSTQPMLVTVLDKTLKIGPEFCGAGLDVEAAVDAALEKNHGIAATHTADILPYLQLDEAAVKAVVESFAAQFPTEGRKTTWEIIDRPDQDSAPKALVITVGTVYYDMDVDSLMDAVLEAYNTRRFQVEYDCSRIAPDTVDLDAIYAENCAEPVDAILDPETYEVVPSRSGIAFNLESTREMLKSALPEEILEIPMEEILPERTTEELEAMLFRDVLGTFTAKASSSPNRDTNLRLACESINGIVLNPGDSFSYNKALGERTPEKGYKPAASYVGNETVDSYGGGICQPSSALYYCVLMADLEVVQRHCHTYVSSYVPFGMDATVDWSGPDFKFRNNTNFPLRIEAQAKGGNVTISLVGTDEKDYYVKMEYEILETKDFEVIEKKMEPGSTEYKDGDVITTPYTGYNVQTYKLKYSKETNELISRETEAYSDYSKRDKVICRLNQKEQPTEPPTTAPPATEPPATEPPATEPPATEPPTTEPPVTEPDEPPTTLPGAIGEATG